MNKELTFIRLITCLLLLVFLGTTVQVVAQDIHFSQFYHSPLNLNPARTGVFQGDKRFVGNYRNQWSNVPVEYMTFSGAYDMKLFREGLDHSTFGVGLLFNYDQAGDSRLALTNLGLNVAYTHRLGRRNFLSVGAGLGFSNRGYSTDNLTTPSQFNGDIFSSSFATGEEGLFRNENIFFIDFSAGLNYHYQVPKKRTRVDLGVAMLHINEPIINFYGDGTIALPKRINFFGEATFMVARNLDLIGRALYQQQTKYNELLFGVAGRIHLKKDRAFNDLALQLGISVRMNEFTDAFIPNIELHYNRWLFGLSYDINVSEFSIATNGHGGPEFAVMYKIFNVRTLPVFKQCPIY